MSATSKQIVLKGATLGWATTQKPKKYNDKAKEKYSVVVTLAKENLKTFAKAIKEIYESSDTFSKKLPEVLKQVIKVREDGTKQIRFSSGFPIKIYIKEEGVNTLKQVDHESGYIEGGAVIDFVGIAKACPPSITGLALYANHIIVMGSQSFVTGEPDSSVLESLGYTLEDKDAGTEPTVTNNATVEQELDITKLYS